MPEDFRTDIHTYPIKGSSYWYCRCKWWTDSLTNLPTRTHQTCLTSSLDVSLHSLPLLFAIALHGLWHLWDDLSRHTSMRFLPQLLPVWLGWGNSESVVLFHMVKDSIQQYYTADYSRQALWPFCVINWQIPSLQILNDQLKSLILLLTSPLGALPALDSTWGPAIAATI